MCGLIFIKRAVLPTDLSSFLFERPACFHLCTSSVCFPLRLSLDTFPTNFCCAEIRTVQYIE